VGNAAAARLFRSAIGASGEVEEPVARSIQAKRGGGNELDQGVRADLGAAMGHDFSDVRVHTDAESDALNKSVRAEAFTTGRDVFFGAGKYDPTSNQGRKLLAHELTHVVQQRNAAPASELKVSDPGDASERQAAAVAEHVAAPPVQAPAASVARAEDTEAPDEEVQTAPLARQEADEEPAEEQAAAMPIQRQEDELEDDAG
jgi:hypothetical protein